MIKRNAPRYVRLRQANIGFSRIASISGNDTDDTHRHSGLWLLKFIRMES